MLGMGLYLFLAVRAQPVLPTAARAAARAELPPVEAQHNAASAAPAGSARPAPAPTSAPAALAAPARSVLPPVPTMAARPPTADAGVAEPPPIGPKLDEAMAEANKSYDRGDLEDAKVIAARLLQAYPNNVRMLRIMVSASCIDGDTVVAETYFARLPPSDQAQMRTRCARYGIALPEKS